MLPKIQTAPLEYVHFPCDLGEIHRRKGFGDGPAEERAGVYVSIALPSLNVGTVGGGTSLATQKECLDLVECYGKAS